MVAVHKHKDTEAELLDVELDDLPAELRWREWMNRIEAVIFASATVVPRDMLQKVVGCVLRYRLSPTNRQGRAF